MECIAEMGVRHPLDIGFRHSPLSMQEYRNYVSTVQAIAKGTLERVKKLHDKNCTTAG